jgi:hypothetical protein
VIFYLGQMKRDFLLRTDVTCFFAKDRSDVLFY